MTQHSKEVVAMVAEGFGYSSFGHMMDYEHGDLIVQFQGL